MVLYVCMYGCIMYACVYACIYMYVLCMLGCMYACVYACMYICMYVCMHVGMYVCVCMHALSMHVRMYASMHVCMYVCWDVLSQIWSVLFKVCCSLYVVNTRFIIKPSNAKLNSICHLLALLRAYHILHVSRIRVKGKKCKANPLQARIGPEGSRRLRLPDFKTIGTGRLYPPGNIPGTQFC